MSDEQPSSWQGPPTPGDPQAPGAATAGIDGLGSTPAPAAAPGGGFPTPNGTFRVYDQCDEAKDRSDDARLELIKFSTGPDYALIEKADEAQADVGGVQDQIDEIDAAEVGPYQRLNYWKQVVDEFERWIRYYEDEIRKQQEYIKVLNEDIARARALQSETGDPDKIFESTIKVDQSLIEAAERYIQGARDMIGGLEIQLTEARKDLQKADDEILALEDKRQRLVGDLNEAKRQAAIASDRARKVQAEYERLQQQVQDARNDANANCPPGEDLDDLLEEIQASD